MEHLISGLDRILEQVRTSRQVLFLSDFDGTLAPIVERPDMAVLPVDIRFLLEELAGVPEIKAGIISGRALGDLKRKVGIPGLIYAGNHGLEIEGPGLNFVNPLADEMRPVLRVLRQILTVALGSIKGVFVEDKGLTLSVHYRQADEVETGLVREIMEHSLRGPLFSGVLRLTGGKKVLEVRPAVPWDKGKAIRLLMQRYGKEGQPSGILPIYLGDDLTDEDGFEAIEKYGSGISVHVGEDPTKTTAQYYVKSPGEVAIFLGGLLDISDRHSAVGQFSAV